MELNNIMPEDPIDIPEEQSSQEMPDQPKITYGHQTDGSYLTPFNTTYFYREDFFQSSLAGLIDRAQLIILPEKVDWKTLHEMPQFITPHVVIFDSGEEKIPLGDLAGFTTRGFQRVMVYSDRIDDYATDYISLVESAPKVAKVTTVNNVDLFFDTFITSGSAFTIMLIEDLLRERYGSRSDLLPEEMEDTKFLMRGIKFGRDTKSSVERFLKLAEAGYHIGDRRRDMIIRGQALEDSLCYYAHQIAHTAVSQGDVLVVWINTFLLKSLHKYLLEQLIMRKGDHNYALCLHHINDKISVNVMVLGEKTIPPFNGVETNAGVLTPAELESWWPGIIQ